MLFNKQVTEERIDEVKSKFREVANYWYPKQTNAFELYLKNGSDWSKVPVQDLVRKSWADSWKDMPQVGIDYLASLPEFDEKIFKEITGIEIKSLPALSGKIVKVEIDGKTYTATIS